MNVLLASLALAFAPQGQSPDLSKKISFHGVAMPAKILVANLAAVAEMNLQVSPQTASETLVVYVNDVTVKEVLDRVALAVDGEWKSEEGGVMRLIRPAANLNREAAAERQEKVAKMQAEIKKAVAELNKKPATSTAGTAEAQAAAAMSFPFGGGNYHKQIIQLVSRLNAADMVLNDDDGRVVFSSSPTRMQKLLPGNLEPIVAELVTEHNKAAAAAAKKTGEEEETKDELMKQWEEWMKAFGFGQDPKPIEGRPAKLLLIVQGQQFMGGLSATLRLYDANGRVAAEGSTGLVGSDFMEQAMEIGKPKPAPASDDKPIEFSETTKEINSIFSSFMNGANRGKMSKELDAKLSRPDLYDPLSFATTESLFAIARHKKLNLVGCLPDETGSMLEVFTGGQATVNSYLKSLEGSEEVRVTNADGWLLLQPKHPISARNKRCDRFALAKLIAASKSKGTVSLDDIATYALTSPSPYEDSTSMQYIMLFAPNAMQMGMMGMVDWNAVRLWGTLNVTQRDTLAGNGRLPFGNLSPQQRNIVTKMMFGAQSDLKVVDPSEKPKSEMGFADMVKSFMGAQHKDYRQEPTEVMPMGLPSGGYLAAVITKEPVGRAASDDPMLAFTALGADELAMFKYFKEDPNMAQIAGMMPTIGQLRIGERTNITLKFFAAPDVASDKMLQDNKVDPNAPPVSMDNLPPAFQERIKQRYEAFKKSPIPGFGFGTPVKPPL